MAGPLLTVGVNPDLRDGLLTKIRHGLPMSDYRHPICAGACVFITVNLADRRSDLLVRAVDVLRRAVAETRTTRPFAVDAWVVLPDHFHCVWRLPEGDGDVSTRVAAIKARFSRDLRRSGFTPTQQPNRHGVKAGRSRHGDRFRDEAAVWQKRFWEHHIRDDADHAAHVNYCWINPVKHGLVDDPAEWPFSSFNARRT